MKKIILLCTLFFSLTTLAATSQEERANKTVEVTAHFGYNYLMGSSGIGAMYFMDANNLVGLNLGSGNDGDDEEKETYFALHYKHYTGNSFYITGGAFYLNSTEDVNGFWGDVFNYQKEADFTSLGAEVRIGNQWSWKHFTLGCDWIGIGHRFVTFEKESDDVDDVTFTLLNLNIGASF